MEVYVVFESQDYENDLFVDIFEHEYVANDCARERNEEWEKIGSDYKPYYVQKWTVRP